jgi:hypothetical protein
MPSVAGGLSAMVWEKFYTTVKIAVFLDVTQWILSEIHWHSCVASLKTYLGPNLSTLQREKRCSLETSITVYRSTRPLPTRPKSEHSVHHLGKLNSFWSFQYLFFCGVIAQIGPRPPPFEVSRLHTMRHTHGRTPWTSDQLVAEAATLTTHNKHKRWTSTPWAGFVTWCNTYLSGILE